MPIIQLDVADTSQIADSLESGRLRRALTQLANLAGAELIIPDDDRSNASASTPPDAAETPIRHRGSTAGRILCHENDDSPLLARAVDGIRALLEHVLEREAAVSNLAEEMVTNYEELNMLYALLPNIATREDAREIGELLVDESERMLNCRRVSLLVLDETRENLKVLASRGLPEEVRDISIPVSGSIAGQTLLEDDLLVVNNVLNRPDLVAMSRGAYDTAAFSIVRVPLRAQGDALGVLTATEREGGSEFTARDCKLLTGLSAVGSSALMNCRLHAAIKRQMLQTIQALALAVDAKDPYTHDHSRRVSDLCVATAKKLGMSDHGTSREVQLAGLLHDIGKIGVPDSVLRKTGPLSAEEFEVAKSHIHIGARIVQRVEGLEQVVKAILHHHERFDGLGYPSGLAAKEIPVMASLVTVADAFDCLTSDRPYRKAMAVEEALAELGRCKGTHFDPAVVDSFAEVIEEESRQA